MKIARCYLRMQISIRYGKDTFSISSMVKGWKIPEARNEIGVSGEWIRGSVALSVRMRLKRPCGRCPLERRRV